MIIIFLIDGLTGKMDRGANPVFHGQSKMLFSNMFGICKFQHDWNWTQLSVNVSVNVVRRLLGILRINDLLPLQLGFCH